MPTQPEPGARLQAVLRHVRRRLIVRRVLEGAAVGLTLGALVSALVRFGSWSAIPAGFAAGAATLSAAAIWFFRGGVEYSLAAAAAVIERSHDFKNIVVTAAELSSHPERAQSWVRQRVFADADVLLERVDVGRIGRLSRPIAVSTLALAGMMAIWAGVPERASRLAGTAIERVRQGATGSTSAVVTITLDAPAYMKQPVRRLSNPQRIEAVEGTRLTIEFPASGSSDSVRFGAVPLRTSASAGVVAAELRLTQSGYLAIGTQERTTLIPVAVTPDRPPAIRVEQPGRDLMVGDANNAVAVEASATDDYGLTHMVLRYTTVSGSGEQFQFREGEVPVAIVPRDRLTWRARGAFAPARLGLQPGDSLIYRFVARDGRAGEAGTSVSDSFFIEIVGPQQAALEGSAMPPEGERYALSQQMIVVKIERLREQEPRVARDRVVEQATQIAAEQRAVKANFIFLMGGDVEDEEIEAEQSSDIQEGRLQHTARREIVRAIDHMTRAEQGLVAVDSGSALRQAKLAVESLQRAFGHSRYLLRTLPERDRIDPSRRLTGKLDGARSSRRAQAHGEPDVKTESVRRLFTLAMAIAENLAAGHEVSAELSALSERTLAIDPADPTWQSVAQQLGTLRDRLAAGDSPDSVLQRLRHTVGLIAAEAQRGTRPSEPAVIGGGALRGAWAQEHAVARPPGQ